MQATATSTTVAAHEAAGFTGRFTAGLRFVESTCVPHPLLPSDPLAGALAGDRGLALAKQELEQLVRDQGPGKHLRVPARSRLIDDTLEQEIARLQAAVRHGPDAHLDSDGPSGPRGSPPRPAPAAVSSRCRRCACQVVSLGAGMCTRPWRLPCLAGCAVFELDLPHIAATKTALLAEAGAQTSHTAHTLHTLHTGASSPSSSSRRSSDRDPCQGRKDDGDGGDGDGGCNPTASAAAASAAAGSVQQGQQQVGESGGPTGPPPLPQQQGQQQQEQQEEEETGRHRFPLLAASYVCIGADLSDAATTNNTAAAAGGGGGGISASGGGGGLAAALAGAGFDPATPTIWVLEALLYYMPLAAASELLCSLAGLSAAGSRLVVSCVDRELLEASWRGVPKGHVFADLWHFETEALLYDTRAFGECWQIDWTGQPEPEARGGAGGAAGAGAAAGAADAAGAEGASDPHQRRRRPLPASTRRLAKERLGADTYVALYGGSELLFVAGLRPQQQHQQ
ncbi:hypothetical protein PLESTB_000329000 [Pleodorina starrii]|uniref:Uncharacterized protein n=1 Tax=Pleodorina starrii TaxID=330485 RepID=A0A9W6EYP8_9CHLO|nr:hypothetical protein PLESTB_000329000 [Pleodorina starrii]GLC75105.1 hypothetical protein PLESTF_001594400 [Pleodorina starrii]